MTISKTIAGLISLTLVAIAAGMLLNIGSFPALAKQVSRDPALIFVSGVLLFIAGLAIDSDLAALLSEGVLSRRFSIASGDGRLRTGARLRLLR